MKDADQRRAAFIPGWLDDLGLPAAEFRVYCHVARRGECYDKIETICEIAHLSRPTVCEALKVLVATQGTAVALSRGRTAIGRGLLSKERRKGTTSVYRVVKMSNTPWSKSETRDRKNETRKGNPSEGNPSKGLRPSREAVRRICDEERIIWNPYGRELFAKCERKRWLDKDGERIRDIREYFRSCAKTAQTFRAPSAPPKQTTAEPNPEDLAGEAGLEEIRQLARELKRGNAAETDACVDFS